MIAELLIDPFVQYAFMQRALAVCLALSCVCPILGIILLLKRMSLMGEALSHGILPGIAAAFLIWGVWLPGFSMGGIVAGFIIAGLSVLVNTKTRLPQDACFSGFYLVALALGVILVAKAGSVMNVMHLLFGTVLGVDAALLQINVVTVCISLIVLRVIFRPLLYQCFDPLYMQSVGYGGNRYTFIFICLVVTNLVQACQALGTLMALGLMMIPAISARLLFQRLHHTLFAAVAFAMLSSYVGLLASYHYSLAPGPTIVLVAGLIYGLSLVYVLSTNFSSIAFFNRSQLCKKKVLA